MKITSSLNITVKFRYRQKDIPIELEVDGNCANVYYPQKSAAVTPGQEAVFYDGDKCLGGGVIEEVYIQDDNVFEKIKTKADQSYHG